MLTSRFTRPGVPAVLGPWCRVIARSNVTGGLMVNRKISEQGHFMRSLCVPLFVGHKIIERIRANCVSCAPAEGSAHSFLPSARAGGKRSVRMQVKPPVFAHRRLRGWWFWAECFRGAGSALSCLEVPHGCRCGHVVTWFQTSACPCVRVAGLAEGRLLCLLGGCSVLVGTPCARTCVDSAFVISVLPQRTFWKLKCVGPAAPCTGLRAGVAHLLTVVKWPSLGLDGGFCRCSCCLGPPAAPDPDGQRPAWPREGSRGHRGALCDENTLKISLETRRKLLDLISM